MRAELARWSKRLVACGIIAGALAYIPYRVYGSEGYVKYRELDRQHAMLTDGNVALRQENGRLRREITRLRDDLDTIETVARDELGLVGPGEVVFQIERAPRVSGGAPSR